ncbi:ammonium transporter Rh type B isoform X2 [Notamacropus eugenii]|uniref:ammonium transporter Rh type B isoform X2 n=1 Tax=Notamacropus eugenii TaxID=9315 RepID=UPI003B674DEF
MARNSSHATGLRVQLPVLCFFLQAAIIILFSFFVRYNHETDSALWHQSNHSDMDNDFYFRYPSFQDVHTMIFIGFGFLMTFLQRYGFSSIGFNFLLSAFSLQWSTLVQGFLHSFHGGKIYIGVERVLYRSHLDKSKHREGSVYHSDLFAMIGTIFLWIFWPSFNSAPTNTGDGQHRTALNTYYSLGASTLSTFAFSALLSRGGKLDMVHIQNAALAGGVVVGTSGEMMITPFGALIAGFLAGTISTLGYKFLMPILESKFKVQDTCGVHNLHGMPGVLGALLGALVAGLATHQTYGDGLENVFPLIAEGHRTATSQAVYQLFGLFVTLLLASLGGGVGGLLLRLPCLSSPPDSQCYEDQIYWEVPLEHEDEVQGHLRSEDTETQA